MRTEAQRLSTLPSVTQPDGAGPPPFRPCWSPASEMMIDLLMPIKYPALIYIISSPCYDPPWYTVLFYFSEKEAIALKMSRNFLKINMSETKYEARTFQCFFSSDILKIEFTIITTSSRKTLVELIV